METPTVQLTPTAVVVPAADKVVSLPILAWGQFLVGPLLTRSVMSYKGARSRMTFRNENSYDS